VAVREHFFVKNAVPYLTLVVTYTLAEVAAPAPAGTKPASIRWYDLLDPADRPLFQTLRDWRRERSKQDGVPPYVICTDRILAGIAQQRPQSLTSLGKVPGVGAATPLDSWARLAERSR
jgi:ATP-dependent DNA helicase RecQ